MTHLSYSSPEVVRTPPTSGCLNCGQPHEAHGRFDACPNGGTAYAAGARQVSRAERPDLWRDRECAAAQPVPYALIVRKLPPKEPKPAAQKRVSKPKRGGGGWKLRADVTADKIRAWQAQGKTLDQIAELLDVSRATLVTRLSAAADPGMKRCACGADKYAKSAMCFKCRRKKVDAERRAAMAPEFICGCGEKKRRKSAKCSDCTWRDKISASICACGKPKYRDSKACIYCRAKAGGAGRIAAAKARREAKCSK